MERALQNVINLYRDQGSPPIDQVAEQADMSTATVQRYLSGNVKRPDYSKIVALERALSPNPLSAPDIDPAIVRQMEEPEQLQALVLQLRQMNIDELADNDAKWRERVESAERGHQEEFLRITQLHTDRVDHVQRAHEAQIRQIQEGHHTQMEMMRELITMQKTGDEKSKDYLKKQIFFWRIFSILLIAAFILLLIADITNPTRGWIRFISGLNLSFHAYS